MLIFQGVYNFQVFPRHFQRDIPITNQASDSRPHLRWLQRRLSHHKSGANPGGFFTLSFFFSVSGFGDEMRSFFQKWIGFFWGGVEKLIYRIFGCFVCDFCGGGFLKFPADVSRGVGLVGHPRLPKDLQLCQLQTAGI